MIAFTAMAFVFLGSSIVTSAERALALTLVTGAFLSLFQSRPLEGWSRQTWMIFASLVLIHLVVVAVIRLPNISFGAALVPFAFPDALVLWLIFKRVERRFPVGPETTQKRGR